jgi:hypothetical protein
MTIISKPSVRWLARKPLKAEGMNALSSYG